ncbi:putative histone-arginine methyltransferase 1.3 [Gossypium australe]|uniref:type I protein arginine methyltransferase n=1 Tax=Gossypium australe TaxID=47621 RepID=A0A5B6WIY5_9ROSI|nr:putative histone-arginine methyltransferase 1.3 [Gossypium australe]
MDDSSGLKHKELEFTLAAVSQLSSSSLSSSSSSSSSVIARFSADSGVAELRFHRDSEFIDGFNVDIGTSQLFKLGPVQSLCVSESFGARIHLPNGAIAASKSKFDYKIEPSSAKMYFHYYGQLLHQQNMLQDYVRTGTYYAAVIENRVDFTGRVVVDVGAGSGILSLFAAQAGAKHVYAVEASEMAEYARKLIAGNPALAQRITVIKGKVEEVELAEKADILISEPMGTLLVNERMLESYIIARDRFLVPNGKMFPSIGRIHMAPFSDEYLFVEIANKKLQEYSFLFTHVNVLRPSPVSCFIKFQGLLPETHLKHVIYKCKIMLSTPMLVLSATEFSFHHALINYTGCTVDFALYVPPPYPEEIAGSFLAATELLWCRSHPIVWVCIPRPVVDAFDPRLLVSPPLCHVIDFNEIKEEDLFEIDIPLKFIASVGTRVHGLACWFDVLFNGSAVQRWLTTAPGAPTTHWYQIRCVLSQPIYVLAGQEITGRLHMIAHNAQSYTMYLSLSAKMWGPGAVQGGILQTSSGKLDLKEPYYRMSQPQSYTMAQDQQPQQLLQAQAIPIHTEDLDEAELLQQPSENTGPQLQ